MTSTLVNVEGCLKCSSSLVEAGVLSAHSARGHLLSWFGVLQHGSVTWQQFLQLSNTA